MCVVQGSLYFILVPGWTPQREQKPMIRRVTEECILPETKVCPMMTVKLHTVMSPQAAITLKTLIFRQISILLHGCQPGTSTCCIA